MVLQKGLSAAGPAKGLHVLHEAWEEKKGAGNSQPAKRVPFPELSQQKLDDKLYAYTRDMGIKEALKLHEYVRLEPQQAESPRSLCKLSKLLKALLEVPPSAKVKYKYLKQSMVYLQQTWGYELLSAHWTCEKGLLAGRAADALLVVLSHWRRCTASSTAWQRFCSKLDESQCQLMEQVKKKMVLEKPKRKLLPHVSDVSMDSKGFPAMTAQGPEEEDEVEPVGSEETEEEYDETEEEDEDEKEAKKAKKNDLEAMESSPPPVVKKDWRAAAGCSLKKPASKLVGKKKGKVSDAGLAKGPTAKKGLGKGPSKCKGTEKVLIHQASLSIGGGKNQAYIQHVPGPGDNKRLIIGISKLQASYTTKTHKELAELLLPACKKAKATKADICAERAKLLSKFAK